MLTRLLLALGASLAVAPHAAAQAAAPTRMLTIRCISFRVDKPLPPLFAHPVTAAKDATGAPVTVKAYLNFEADAVSVGGDELVFTTAADRASLADPAQVVARLKVPRALRSAILMFLPGDGRPGSPPCRVLPIDDSTRAFPRGSVQVVNLSHQPLRLVLEKTAFEFKSGESKLIDNPPVGNAHASAVTAFTRAGDQWLRFSSAIWPHPGQKRVIKVAFDNPASRQVEIRGIRDIAVRDPAPR